MDDADSPLSKRSASEEPTARTPQPAGQAETAASGDELTSEAAQLDKMDIATSAGPSAAAARSRPSAEEQRKLITLDLSPPVGTAVHVLKRSWYRMWKEATEPKEENQLVRMDELPPIDNQQLVDEGGRFVEPPKQSVNVVLLKPEVYALLAQWYGEDGPPVIRKMVATAADKLGKLDSFPPTFHLCRIYANPPSADERSPPSVTVSLAINESVAKLKALCRMHLQLDADEDTRYWHYPVKPRTQTNPGTPKSYAAATADARPFVLASEIRDPGEEVDMREDNAMLGDARLGDVDHYIAVEQKDDEGHWLVDTTAPTDPEETEDETGGSQASVPARPHFGGGGSFDKKSAATSLQPRYKSGNAPSSSSVVASTSKIATRSQTGSSSRVKGLTGLGNLGNTCFMNSALQCLSNTPELRDYFLADVWRDELNEDNPLGMDGQVAKAFANLVKALWSGSGSSYTPREFKQTIGKFRPMFIGWSQQDSQELIAFLLDGLHEDLNRIIKKPYTEIPDWDGDPTPERMYKHAAHIWDLYRRRNDSVMIDLFFGQFRSTLTCLECNKVSYKFDEFSSVTLNLPKTPWQGTIFVVPLDISRPKVKLTLELGAEASVRDAKVQVGKLLGIDAHRLICVDIFSNKVYKFSSDTDQMKSFRKDDVIGMMEIAVDYRQVVPMRVNKLPVTEAQRDDRAGIVMCQVINQKHTGPLSFGTKSGPVGQPSILGLKYEDVTSYEALYDILARTLARNTRHGQEFFEPSDPNASMPEDDAQQSLADGEASYVPSSDVVPIKDLFRILVNSSPQATPPTNIPSGLVDLKKRIEERAKPTGSAPIPIPGAFPSKPEDATAGTSPAANTMAVDEPVTPAPVPIIQTGDMIVLDWAPAAWKHFFEDDASRFASFASVEDPAIAQRKSESKTKTLSLESCLADFCKPERLGEDNPWKCPVCDKLQENTSKQLDLWKVPDILVIHLKRFSKTGGYSWQKMDAMVDFPLENWDLTNWVEGRRVAEQLKRTEEGRQLLGEDFEDKPLLYDLFAVDNHYGGMGGGHYTAFAKNTIDGKWHNYDDSSVRPVSSPDDVRTSAAYLLFYRRQTERALGGRTTDIVASAMQSRSQSLAGSEAGLEGDTTITDATPPSPGLATPPDSDDGSKPPSYHRVHPENARPLWGSMHTRSDSSSDSSNDAAAGSDNEWQAIAGRRGHSDDDELPDALDASIVRRGARPTTSPHFGARAQTPGPQWGFGASEKAADEEADDIIFVSNVADRLEGDDVVHEIAGPDEEYISLERPSS